MPDPEQLQRLSAAFSSFQRLDTYNEISKPKRQSIAVGVCQVMEFLRVGRKGRHQQHHRCCDLMLRAVRPPQQAGVHEYGLMIFMSLHPGRRR